MDTERLPIRDRRLKLDLSQQQLAANAGCSLASVRLYEGGIEPRKGRSPVLDQILDALNAAERSTAA